MPRLPPVPKSPQTRLRATFSPGVGYSQVTFFQSHSSSSATICARPVSEPWPISERAMRTTTVSSGRITTQGPISVEPSAARTTCTPPKGLMPIARPPPTAALETRKARRESLGALSMVVSLRLGSRVDRFAHLLEGAAAADVGDRRVDLRVGGVGRLRKQRRRRHDHAGLAVAALRHVVSEPGLLYLGELAALRETLDGGDLLADCRARRHRAGAHRRAVDVDRACPALRDAAAVLGAGQAGLLADHPQQRGLRIHVEVVGLAVDGEA